MKELFGDIEESKCDTFGNKKSSEIQSFFYWKTSRQRFVPRAGIEPARIAPLVFETSASTDSAIWAFLF